MELITNWEIFNEVSLQFCQFQGLVGLIIITGIAIFKHNLGEVFSPFKLKGGGSGKKNEKYILNCSKK